MNDDEGTEKVKNRVKLSSSNKMKQPQDDDQEIRLMCREIKSANIKNVYTSKPTRKLT